MIKPAFYLYSILNLTNCFKSLYKYIHIPFKNAHNGLSTALLDQLYKYYDNSEEEQGTMPILEMKLVGVGKLAR